MDQNQAKDPVQNQSLTRRVIEALGTRQQVADLITKSAGFRVTRQAISKWHAQGALPFQSADLYARILASAARRISFDVTKNDLLEEVEVPANRMPKATQVAT